MDFTFTEDQLLFKDSVREFLLHEVTPERIRQNWGSESGRDQALWQQLAELGLTAVTAPESSGGLGMSELDFVLLAQECGYVALPEPLVNSVMVAVPLLKQLGGSLAEEWLPLVAGGEAIVVAGIGQNQLVEDAHIADLVLLAQGGDIYALTQGQFTATFNESVDPSRRLFSLAVAANVAPVLSGSAAEQLLMDTLNRGALGCAAQALGLAQRMIDLSVAYTAERKQFGKAIATFQAVKHRMADVAVQLEYAKAPVHRAAYAIAHGQQNRSIAVSHAKLVACAAANLAAKNSIQVHGAMGYTWEVDLHIFMKKAWALANTWGDAALHKARISEFLFADDVVAGADKTFAVN